MRNYKILCALAIAVSSICSCSLEEDMVSSGSKELIFGSVQGLEAYSLSFYEQLPSLKDLSSMEGYSIDLGYVRVSATFILKHIRQKRQLPGVGVIFVKLTIS
jgi:hypothetical protein